jgi:dTDP-glucose pyrophosphorylase/CBS domain-containing protein
MSKSLEKYLISHEATIREALLCINKSKGIALVVNSERHLLGTVTDGDIRRAVLAGIDLETPVQHLLERRNKTLYPNPITAPQGTLDADLLHLMNERAVRHIPLVDEAGCVKDIVLIEELVRNYERPLKAVIMAGGFGKRLMPLTEEIPKPMLPVGDKPILELIVNQLQNSGIRKVHMTTHYRPEIIKQHFGDGQKFGLDIQYVNEDQPMGTAGALGGIEAFNEPMLVLNGDVLTRVDFRAMLAFHREQKAEMTVAVRQFDFQVPYGVIQCDGAHVSKVHEKPTYKFFINAGIYLLESSAHHSIPSAQRFDMTDLIEKLISEGRHVVAFPIVEYWMDIGRHKDYMQAKEDVKLWESAHELEE